MPNTKTDGQPVSWDPLEHSATGSDVLLAQRRAVTNILKSYTGFFDPFCELIQNALDAVDARAKLALQGDYSPKIDIVVDLQNGQFSVCDNGIGFTESEFRAFLSPHITFKDMHSNRGRKGVGATYLAFGFNYLEAATKTENYTTSALIRGGREWIDDTEETAPKPRVTATDTTHNLLTEVECGSAFILEFSGKGIRPGNLGWYNATTAKQWQGMLLAKTPLGHVNLPSRDPSGVTFAITVVDRQGDTTFASGATAYSYPDTVISNCCSVSGIQGEIQKRAAKGQDASFDSLPAKYRKLIGVYGHWTTDELVELLNDRHPEAAEILKTE